MNVKILNIYYKLPYFLKCIIASVKGWKLKKNRIINRKKWLKEIKERDKWNNSELKAFQDKLVKQMLSSCIKNVPYYRDYNSSQSKNPDWDPLKVESWPILEKDYVRNNPGKFISDEYNKQDLLSISTSGTSGKPMKYWFSKDAISYWYALYESRIKIWNGVSDNDKWANIGGQLICEVNRIKPPYWVINISMKQLYLSSYHINSETVFDYIMAIKKYRIQYILGYVSSIFNLANESLKQGIELPKLKLVITNAEPLLEGQRRVISKAFNCKVVQTYSSCEFSFSANEDMAGDMYVWPEAGKIEVVDKNGVISNYGLGELIVTGLINKAMPLIRYRVGDYISIKKGGDKKLNYDYIDEIFGRTDDLIVTKSGKLIGRLDPVFKFDLNIKEAQIIQEDYLRFTINIVPDNGFSEKDSQSIEQRLKDRVGNDIFVNFEFMNQIPRSANGKFKAVISKIKN